MSMAGEEDAHQIQHPAGDALDELDDAELAALADQIEAGDEEGKSHVPAPATADAEPQPHHHYNHQTSGSSWNTAYDHNSQRWYYYNIVSGETSWTPPPDWLPNQQAGDAEGQDAAQPSKEPALAGHYYKDAYAKTQGPFTKDQLTAWRGALPMDLHIWYQDAGDTPDTKQDGDKEAAATEHQHETIELAKIIGDGELLAQWRQENPDMPTKQSGCVAPTAEAYEADLKKDTFTTLAEAALAGLPPDDQAVHLARMATSTGQPLQEVVSWSRDAGKEYEVTAMHASRMGRIQVADPKETSLYAEFGSWVDPKSMEEQLQKAAQRKKRALTGDELRALKERKKQMKDKKMREWLMND